MNRAMLPASCNFLVRNRAFAAAATRFSAPALQLSLFHRSLQHRTGWRGCSAFKRLSTDRPENLDVIKMAQARSDSVHFTVPTFEQRPGSEIDETAALNAQERSRVSPTPAAGPSPPVLSASTAVKANEVVSADESGMLHPVWSAAAVQGVKITHLTPVTLTDRLALSAVRALRLGFDVASGYAFGRMDERAWLNRVVFLETVAGVPGMVGAAVRHLQSLRRMERDYGWIHTLLEEAENERMHLMTALALRRPGILFRAGVLVTQGIFLVGFAAAYATSRTFAHRFVGYLEEEAVKTYTRLLEEIEGGRLPLFTSLPAHPLARCYWQLDDHAMFSDVVLAIRADEAHHRRVNHTFAEMKANEPNPFAPGS